MSRARAGEARLMASPVLSVVRAGDVVVVAVAAEGLGESA